MSRLEIFKDAVLVSLERCAPSNRRKIATDEVTVDAVDPAKLSFGKPLFLPRHWKPIRHELGSIKAFLMARSTPGYYFRPGCYPVKKVLLPAVMTAFEASRARLSSLVEEFVSNYETYKDEARSEILGSLYDEADYPSVDDFRRAVRVRLTIIEIGVPDDIDPAVRQAQVAQAEAEWRSSIEDIRMALRAGMSELVGHLCDRLQPSEDGTSKVLRQSSVDKLQEFLEFFEHRDLTNDAGMQVLVGQARQAMLGVDVDRLRSDSVYRGEILGNLQGVRVAVDGMVEEQRTRLIDFGVQV